MPSFKVANGALATRSGRTSAQDLASGVMGSLIVGTSRSMATVSSSLLTIVVRKGGGLHEGFVLPNSGVKPRRSGRGYKPRKPGADFI